MVLTERDDIRSIGVFHLNQLGDLIFSLPALEALRGGFPSARITSVVPAGLAGLLCPSPWLDACITHRRTADLFATLRRVRRAEFDLAVCLSQSPRVLLLAAASGARHRAGFESGPLAHLLTQRVAKATTPSLANNLRLVESLGCPVERRDYLNLLAVEKADRELAEQLLGERGVLPQERIVVIGAGASSRRRDKEWPFDRFVEVARAATRHEGVNVAFVGAEARLDTDLSQERIHDLGGTTSLRALMGVLQRADLFVGIDSGPLHLAAAVGAPCIALFGPTDPAVTGPCGEGHVVLHCPDDEGGLGALPVESVVAAVDAKLKRL